MGHQNVQLISTKVHSSRFRITHESNHIAEANSNPVPKRAFSIDSPEIRFQNVVTGDYDQTKLPGRYQRRFHNLPSSWDGRSRLYIVGPTVVGKHVVGRINPYNCLSV